MEINEVKQKLSDEFRNENQLNVVFSSKKRILVEAAAGCGKTKTIVGRVSYLIGTRQISFSKKILALTFSINAAYKLKNDVARIIKVGHIDDVIKVNNFHSFARSLIRVYGAKLHPNLINIDLLTNFSDDNVKNFDEVGIKVEIDILQKLVDYNTAIKEVNFAKVFDGLDDYLKLVSNICLPNNCIPFNAILCYAIKLLTELPIMRKYLHSIFTHIIVDEFQDTNLLMSTFSVNSTPFIFILLICITNHLAACPQPLYH